MRVTEKEYKPYYLEAVTETGDGNFVLDVHPKSADEDHYYEIHLEADQPTLQAIKYTVDSYIYIHLVSASELDLYLGEFLYENSVDDGLSYESFEFKTFEKTLREEWKPKYNQLLTQFKKVFARKLAPYEATRTKVVSAYRRIYAEQLKAGKTFGLTSEEIDKTHLFHQIFRHSGESNPAWAGLEELVNPEFMKWRTPKDWQTAFRKLEAVHTRLQNADVNDYATIRDHMVNRYTSMFNYMLPNLKYNHKDIDEEKHKALFADLMRQLRQTGEEF